ncbi:MAG: GNAT family N-acetyltransferase [Pseudomonadota bacterium]
MVIREANYNDAASIAKIHSSSWRDTYGNVLTKDYLESVAPQERESIWKGRLKHPKPNQYVIVAEIEDAIIGFACAFYAENSKWGSYLDSLHVIKERQSQGVGQLLLATVARWCCQRDANLGLCLLVNQDNVHAQNFYKHLGARNTEESVWNAPDGSVVPTYWFVWSSVEPLASRG